MIYLDNNKEHRFFLATLAFVFPQRLFYSS